MPFVERLKILSAPDTAGDSVVFLSTKNETVDLVRSYMVDWEGVLREQTFPIKLGDIPRQKSLRGALGFNTPDVRFFLQEAVTRGFVNIHDGMVNKNALRQFGMTCAAIMYGGENGAAAFDVKGNIDWELVAREKKCLEQKLEDDRRRRLMIEASSIGVDDFSASLAVQSQNGQQAADLPNGKEEVVVPSEETVVFPLGEAALFTQEPSVEEIDTPAANVTNSEDFRVAQEALSQAADGASKTITGLEPVVNHAGNSLPQKRGRRPRGLGRLLDRLNNPTPEDLALARVSQNELRTLHGPVISLRRQLSEQEEKTLSAFDVKAIGEVIKCLPDRRILIFAKSIYPPQLFQIALMFDEARKAWNYRRPCRFKVPDEISLVSEVDYTLRRMQEYMKKNPIARNAAVVHKLLYYWAQHYPGLAEEID